MNKIIHKINICLHLKGTSNKYCHYFESLNKLILHLTQFIKRFR